ncbi:ATP-binding protein, partial [Psychrobacter sp. SIMBA_152]
MSRVLQNLISNALKHATQTVHISLTANAEKLFLVIEDDGPGIADAEREKVFKPFTRLDKS